MLLFLAFAVNVHPAEFYQGKTIRVIVGGSAGGGFDIYTRAMARHMGKHIPGNPTLIVENMTGAGTLIAAKYLHSSAKPDGLSFGIFNGALILSGALGNKSVDFDMRELEYLGVPVQDSTVCALRKESGVTNMDQWFAAKTPIKLGGLSRATAPAMWRGCSPQVSTFRFSSSKVIKARTRSASPLMPGNSMALAGRGKH